MSGILDNKIRILDTIVTLEGRKQLSDGGIDIKYVTFTDAAAFYKADVDNGSADATNRIYFEASHLPQDQITFLSDPNGKLQNYSRDSVQVIRQGQIVKSTSVYDQTKDNVETNYSTLKDYEFFENIDSLLKSSIDNFDKLRSLSTRDFLFEDDQFGINTNKINFSVTPSYPLEENEKTVNISHLREIQSDPRFSNLLNFKYLPPVNKIEAGGTELGNYSSWGNSQKIDIISILKEHAFFAHNGSAKIIKFDPTSRNNELFMQFFEVSKDTAKKMDVIDFGKWYLTDQQLQELSIHFPSQYLPHQTIHVFFVGKIMENLNENSNSFLHLFTLIFG